jgi:L-arabinose isomerase
MIDEIKELKEIMNELEVEHLDQLYNEIDSMYIDEPENKFTKKVKTFLDAPEAEIAIQIYFNKEEYEEFLQEGRTAVEILKESFETEWSDRYEKF